MQVLATHFWIHRSNTWTDLYNKECLPSGLAVNFAWPKLLFFFFYCNFTSKGYFSKERNCPLTNLREKVICLFRNITSAFFAWLLLKENDQCFFVKKKKRKRKSKQNTKFCGVGLQLVPVLFTLTWFKATQKLNYLFSSSCQQIKKEFGVMIVLKWKRM